MNTETTTEQAALAEAAQDAFVTIPETTLPNGTIVPAFMVGKYLCSQGADGKLKVTGEGAPWTNINYAAARQACADAGYSLITETQALAMAVHLSGVAANWISGVVGDGNMFQGLHLDLEDADQPYDFSFASPDASERREFFTADGQSIVDAAGNAYTWVFDDVQGDKNGLIARAFAADSPSVTSAPYPSMERGMGWYPDAGSDWSGAALVRGGYWCSGGNAGVFGLGYGWPDHEGDGIGFRCTKPISL